MRPQRAATMSAKHGPHDEERPVEMNGQHAVPLRPRQRRQRREAGDAGAAHEDVDRARAARAVVERRLAPPLSSATSACDGARRRPRRDSSRGDRARPRRRSTSSTVTAAPSPASAVRDGASDARSAAGHQRMSSVRVSSRGTVAGPSDTPEEPARRGRLDSRRGPRGQRPGHEAVSCSGSAPPPRRRRRGGVVLAEPAHRGRRALVPVPHRRARGPLGIARRTPEDAGADEPLHADAAARRRPGPRAVRPDDPAVRSRSPPARSRSTGPRTSTRPISATWSSSDRTASRAGRPRRSRAQLAQLRPVLLDPEAAGSARRHHGRPHGQRATT